MTTPSHRRSKRLAGVLAALALAVVAVPAVVFFVQRAEGSGSSPEPAAGRVGEDVLAAHPVAGTFEPDDTRLADCDEDEPRCLEQAFGNLAYTEGPKPTLRLFDREIAEQGAVEAGCHRIAHTIGSAALARYEGNVGRAFAEGSASCWSGYYHGILERAFTGVTSKDELGDVARRLCDDEEVRRTQFLAYQCVHGLGHGLMIHTGYNLPFSLEICDLLATDWDQVSCTGGVFMENISSSYGVTSKWLRDDDLVYPCNEVEERHKVYCYLMVTSRINEANGFDWRETARICRTVEKGWVGTCFESFGRDASGNTRQNPREVARLCALAREYADKCFFAAARDMTSNYANGKRAAETCALAPAAAREECYRGIGSILGTLFPTVEELRAACSVVGREHADTCLSGAGPIPKG